MLLLLLMSLLFRLLGQHGGPLRLIQFLFNLGSFTILFHNYYIQLKKKKTHASVLGSFSLFAIYQTFFFQQNMWNIFKLALISFPGKMASTLSPLVWSSMFLFWLLFFSSTGYVCELWNSSDGNGKLYAAK